MRTDWRQLSQILRTSRCAITQLSAEMNWYGSTPMLRKRCSTSKTLLAWTVVNTRWPVSADWMAICAVSESRISPTMILSGSWRRMERSPRAKVSPFFSLIGIWVMPLSWYSTGSSMVMILSSIDRISASAP